MYVNRVPPIFVIQIQIPSEPPTSLFTTVQDGPGWAIVMYYRVTEVTHVLYVCVCGTHLVVTRVLLGRIRATS